MLDIDDILRYYIEVNYTEKKKSDLYMALNLSNIFGLKYYEDRLIDLLSNDDLYPTESKMYIVEETIKENITTIIEQHNIKLDYDGNPLIYEVNEIANFIYIIQNMEDYYFVEYRLSSQDRSKNIIIDIIEHLTLLDKYRLMEIIKDVDDGLLKSIQKLIRDKTDTTEPVNNKYIKNVNKFFEFINDTECLGKTLYKQGFVGKDLDDIISLQSDESVHNLEKNALTHPEQTALDVASLFIISRDTYELPLVMLKKHLHTLITDPTILLRIETIVSKMITDFISYREATDKGYKEITQ